MDPVTSNKRASLLGARTLLGAPGLTTRNKDATSDPGSVLAHTDLART